MKRLLILAVCAISVAGSFIAGTAGRSSATTTPVAHVVLVMEENHSYSQAMSGMPYLKSLAATYRTETNQWAIGFPSLPNYIALTSGQVPSNIAGKDCTATGSCTTGVENVFHQLGSGWRVLAESMPTPCDHANSGEYAVRHSAAPYYTNLANCGTLDTAYSAASAPNITARFTLIVPNLLHDAHDGSLSAADTWLKSLMGRIMATAQYQSGNTLVEITFDSGSGNCGSSCPSQVPLVLIQHGAPHSVLTLKTTHYSLLRLNEELLGVPLLGHAASAADMRNGFGL